MHIQPNSKLVMIGDSITDCERARPVGEGLFDALGNGYVSFVDGLLMARYPAHGIRVVNMGLSGNTVRDLQGRWQSDVLDLRPDWLSICIGINDVWRHFDTPLQSEGQVSLEEYTRTLETLVRTTRPTLKGLILMTPYLIEPNREDG
jgi:lysophospholipase L1-like esterase